MIRCSLLRSSFLSHDRHVTTGHEDTSSKLTSIGIYVHHDLGINDDDDDNDDVENNNNNNNNSGDDDVLFSTRRWMSRRE